MAVYKNVLHETVETTLTDVWNDSCAIDELEYAIENGAVGATTNPVIVGNVLKKEMHLWKDRIAELVGEMATGSEEDVAWRLNEEMAIRGAGLLEPVFRKTGGMKGRISIQTHARYYRNRELMTAQAVHFSTLADNIQVKIPATEAGIAAIEETTAAGVNINATVSFTVPQAVAVAEAVERGLNRLASSGNDVSGMSPVCTIMVGRLDDWLKVVAEKENIVTTPGLLEWPGVAVFKNAYRIFKEKGYRTRLLAAAYRNHYHWSEFIGGDVVLTIPYKWQRRFNSSDIRVEPRIDIPVDGNILAELMKKFPDFVKAYEPDGMTAAEFDAYGATRRTLRSFIAGYDGLLTTIRGIMLPDPDIG